MIPTETEFYASQARDGQQFGTMLEAIALGLIKNPYEPEYSHTEAEKIRNEKLRQLAMKGKKDANNR